ncbi:ABC transporter ATP-binding protein [Kytococcus sedentarius]|uniref:ABC transporter ATP-binding protein n=1 Tax=Kytococcus sedentarius TaxID=1276 RepID=UPI00387A3014
MEAGNSAMQWRGITKAFGGQVAVDAVTLAVPRGAVLGLVGPNGAGKTTVLSMATGLLAPDAGTVEVLGHDVWSDPRAAKALMGVLPDGMRVFDRLSGQELLTYTGRLRGMDESVIAERSAELLQALGLEGAGNKMVVDYSAGMTKKIGLACALIHAPRLLVLDEPLEAVDPVSAQGIRELLAGYAAGGGTVVISSHVMELVESLCSHVAIMREGQLLREGTVEEVREGDSLQNTFIRLVGREAAGAGEGLSWLRSS